MQTRSGRLITPSHSGTATPRRRRGQNPGALEPATLEKHVQSAFAGHNSNRTVTKSVRRTVEYKGNDRRVERVVEREEHGEGGVSQSARLIRDSVAGVFNAASNLLSAASGNGSDSEMSEGDATLFSYSQGRRAKPREEVSRVLDFSSNEEDGGGGASSRSRAGDSPRMQYHVTARGVLPGVIAPGVSQTEVFVREQRTIRVKNASDGPQHLYGPDEVSDVEDESTQVAVMRQKKNQDHPEQLPFVSLGQFTLWTFLKANIIPETISLRKNPLLFFISLIGNILHLLFVLPFIAISQIFTNRNWTTQQKEAFYLLLIVFIALLFILISLPYLWSSLAFSKAPVIANCSRGVREAALSCGPVHECFKGNHSELQVIVSSELVRLGLIEKDGKIIPQYFPEVKEKTADAGGDGMLNRLQEVETRLDQKAENFESAKAEIRQHLSEMLKKEMDEAVKRIEDDYGELKLKVNDEDKASGKMDAEVLARLPEIVKKEIESVEKKMAERIEMSFAGDFDSIKTSVTNVKAEQAKLKTDMESRANHAGDITSLKGQVAAMKSWIDDSKERPADQRESSDNKKFYVALAEQKDLFSDELKESEGKLQSAWKADLDSKSGEIREEIEKDKDALKKEVLAEVAKAAESSPPGLTKEEITAIIGDEISKTKEELECSLTSLATQNEEKLRSDLMSKLMSISGSDVSGLQMAEVKDLVKQEIGAALRLYEADKTGKADYALYSAGGRVAVQRCSRTYDDGLAYMSFYGMRLWSIPNTPRTVIEPGVLPGQCWPLEGSKGFLVIKLAVTINVTEISYEHTDRNLTVNGTIFSAPKEFAVFGLADETDEIGTHLGSYVYDKDGDTLQSFPVQKEVLQPFRFILFSVSSNHGDGRYTCLYRIRVHGKPADV
eukprot:m.8065 g.8065  ORF g.8065 m.8065 type:complete len:896 (+) comp20306_c0_seq1:149-2836(+)